MADVGCGVIRLDAVGNSGTREVGCAAVANKVSCCVHRAESLSLRGPWEQQGEVIANGNLTTELPGPSAPWAAETRLLWQVGSQRGNRRHINRKCICLFMWAGFFVS